MGLVAIAVAASGQSPPWSVCDEATVPSYDGQTVLDYRECDVWCEGEVGGFECRITLDADVGQDEELVIACGYLAGDGELCDDPADELLLDPNVALPNGFEQVSGRDVHRYEESDEWDVAVTHGPDVRISLRNGLGLLEPVAAAGDPVPEAERGETFIDFGTDVAIDGGWIVFSARGTGGVSGVYSKPLSALGGAATRIADNSQARPRGAGNYDQPTSVDVSGGIALWTDSSGLYRAPADGSGTPTQPAAIGDSLGSGTLGGGFSAVRFWGDRAVFRGSSGGGDCIAAADLNADGVVDLIAGNTTPIPGGVGNFGPLQNPAALGPTVVFEAFNPSFQYLGLYAWVEGSGLSPLLLRGDPLAASTVFVAQASERSLFAGGARVALTVELLNDDLHLVTLCGPPIFRDDFESGDVAAWSSSTP
ncbi:MAG: hypothetical protein DWQ36_03000 [Acidobacteria bacterium]|nr:MAG: hypothetical protein DWQ30_02405 [Acidobacteriota bacterium]REK11092.1 MAG: hypothetical protein DWQ36_03000 [Acidobacteriota bacterium]